MRSRASRVASCLAVAALASLSSCKKAKDADHEGTVVGRSVGPPEVRVFRRTYEHVRASGHRSWKTDCTLYAGAGKGRRDMVAGLWICEPKFDVVVDPKGARAAASAGGRTQIVYLRQPSTWSYVMNQSDFDWARVPDFLTGGASAALEHLAGGLAVHYLADEVLAEGGADAVVRMIAEADDARTDHTCTPIESSLQSALGHLSPELAKRVEDALSTRLMKPGRTNLRRAALSAPDSPELGAALLTRLEEILEADLDDPVAASLLLRRAALVRPVEAGALACRLLARTPSAAVLAEKLYNSFPGSPSHLSDSVLESIMGAIILGQTKCAAVPQHRDPCHLPDDSSGNEGPKSMVCRSVDAATCAKLAGEIARGVLAPRKNGYGRDTYTSHACPLGPHASSRNASVLVAAAWRMQDPDARRCPEKVSP